MKHYDYIIVGAGLYGCVFAHEMHLRGKKCLVVEKRDHLGGNCYSKEVAGIDVHWYGAHIFHTSNERVWRYMQQLCTFNNYINSPIAIYKGAVYNLPFNMNTFTKMWPDVITPDDARRRIAEQRALHASDSEPANLEEQGLRLVGYDLYETLVKGYSEKQWGRPATEIPAFVLRRIPLRFTFDNNYFNDPYQGIPIGGYTRIFEHLLDGVDVRLNEDFLAQKDYYLSIADRVLYTGRLDAYFNYSLGHLEFRTLRFDHRIMRGVENYQGNAVVNYTDADIPHTRVIEHKHFQPQGMQQQSNPDTVVTFEYPEEWQEGAEPYYPINDIRNNTLAEQYRQLALAEPNVSFGGRLAEYKYYDMDKVVEAVLNHEWLSQP